MNYKPGTWYNELYRIFSQKTLLTVAQTVILGQCLRAIQAGENAEYHLNELYYSLGTNLKDKQVKEALDEYIHSYIKHYKEDIDDENDVYLQEREKPSLTWGYKDKST